MDKNKKKVLVIGGGLGSLSSAISLKASGYDVELHEKNSHLGGKLNLLEKEGFSFDLGPSIFTFPYIFERLFKISGKKMEDYMEIVEPQVHWRCFFEDGDRIDLLKDINKMAEANSSLGSGDIKQLKNFLAYSKKLYENVKKGYFDKGVDTLSEAIKAYGIKTSLFGLDIFSTVHQGVKRYIKNTHLSQIIEFFIKYVGSSAYNAPAILNMMQYGQFHFGLWYVKGGMYNLARALKKLIDELGIKVYMESEIVKLNKKDSKINYAVNNKGKEFPADIFVSNMEVIPAYTELTGENGKFLKNYDKFEPACSGLVLHLGVKKKYSQLAHHNFFFSKNPKKHFSDVFDKHILPQDPTIYLVAASRTNPDVAPVGCDNIKVLPHIPHLQDEPFTQDDYSKLKKVVLDKLERMGLKDLRKNTLVEDIWTPEDIKKTYYSNKGAIYGFVSDKKKNLGFKAPKKSKKYSNLYFTGGSVNPGGGMPMVTLSGQKVAEIINRDNA